MQVLTGFENHARLVDGRDRPQPIDACFNHGLESAVVWRLVLVNFCKALRTVYKIFLRPLWIWIWRSISHPTRDAWQKPVRPDTPNNLLSELLCRYWRGHNSTGADTEKLSSVKIC